MAYRKSGWRMSGNIVCYRKFMDKSLWQNNLIDIDTCATISAVPVVQKNSTKFQFLNEKSMDFHFLFSRAGTGVCNPILWCKLQTEIWIESFLRHSSATCLLSLVEEKWTSLILCRRSTSQDIVDFFQEKVALKNWLTYFDTLLNYYLLPVVFKTNIEKIAMVAIVQA